MHHRESGLQRLLRACRWLRPSVRERIRLERMVGPVGVWDALQKFQLDFLKAMGLQPTHDLLDIGCGPLQGGLAFIDYLEPGRYAGVDVSEKCIAEAVRQIDKAGLGAKRPFLAVSRTFGRGELGDRHFDYFWASQLLYHLDDAGLAACLEEVARRMKPGAAMYGDFMLSGGAAERSDNTWRGFHFYYRPFSAYEEAARSAGLTMRTLGILRDHGYPTEGTLGLSNNQLLEFRRR